MRSDIIFERLWNDYTALNPDVSAIYDAFVAAGETVINDHIAFRTLNHPRICIEKLSRVFLDAGYVEKGNYHFEAKKLVAKHYEKQDDPTAPRVFISHLLLEEFSDELQMNFNQLIDQIPKGFEDEKELIFSKDIFGTASFSIYEKLRKESEYAAWVYAFGFRANHFTVSVNHLKKFSTLGHVNDFLKSKGFRLNQSGGEIKGNPEELLEQSSTLAGLYNLQFTDGKHSIPGCYYEFALRYPDEEGNLYNGFIAKSADKIFESTDFYSK
ncbi:MAG: succinyldiaminopimelate aminotransferase [Bacteroidetes bacterium GWE2_42_24]|nr:MAG: succinyldiaminopimelate aminotransferase [Bacteroidetes bacterium GWE2_42_24]OFY32294.1 MAG: succinyldiaminopimelate aminotransferase [Bacteroidetes bacterium GWF2_43_11]PKP26967.1 MAG: DUF1338 domain-containing protein [Bacteroidetes bacterium HGW-Bacteroidetes-22]